MQKNPITSPVENMQPRSSVPVENPEPSFAPQNSLQEESTESACEGPDCPPRAEFTHPADRAEQLELLSLENQVIMLRQMPSEEAAEALAELDEQAASEVLESLDAHDAARILAEMSPDDAVDILDEVNEEQRDAMLSGLTPEDALELRALLTFDSETAGGVMNTEIILIHENLTVDAAILQIRAEMEDKESPYYIYVVDSMDVLIGVLSLRDLMLTRPGTLIRDAVSGHDIISVFFDADQEEVARIMSHYNFLSVPVVDKEGRLMGVVTHDDVLDIIQEQASADMLGMVGAGQDETVDTPWTDSVRLRLPWLAINMFNSALSASIVYMFEGSIAQMALLAVLMPMVANQAGNTGQQALAVMIRQLAMERFDRRKTWTAVLREGKIGLLTGCLMAILAFLGVTLLFQQPALGALMGGALLADMTLGAIAGGSIPLILRALGRDPAQASSIFLTTLTDGAGFFIFLALATMFIL